MSDRPQVVVDLGSLVLGEHLHEGGVRHRHVLLVTEDAEHPVHTHDEQHGLSPIYAVLPKGKP